MVPLAVPGSFLGANACVICRPRRNKSLHFIRHRRREAIYSHSIVAGGLLVISYTMRLMP